MLCSDDLDGCNMTEFAVLSRAISKSLCVYTIEQRFGTVNRSLLPLRLSIPRVLTNQPKVVGCQCQISAISAISAINPPENLYVLFHDTHFVLARSEPLCLGQLIVVFAIENFRIKIIEAEQINTLDIIAIQILFDSNRSSTSMFKSFAVATSSTSWTVRVQFYDKFDQECWVEHLRLHTESSRYTYRQKLISTHGSHF